MVRARERSGLYKTSRRVLKKRHMPKENTHLWFAYSLLEELHGSEMLKCISCSLTSYLLGSVFPDTFYYASSPSLVRIAEGFHGRDGRPTNTFPLAILESSKAAVDVAFAMGFLTHCALDMTFHPVIYYLSGNYYDPDPRKRQIAVRTHRRLETCLDRDLGHRIRIWRIMKPWHGAGYIAKKVLREKYGVGACKLRYTLARQAAFNVAFTMKTAYLLARFLSPALVASPYLGLFYGDVAADDHIPETIAAQDLVDGTPYTASVAELFKKARSLALRMMDAAYSYSKDTITKADLEEAIPGASLDTGRIGMGADKIRFVSSPSEGPWPSNG